jgi:hypothetical protein
MAPIHGAKSAGVSTFNDSAARAAKAAAEAAARAMARALAAQAAQAAAARAKTGDQFKAVTAPRVGTFSSARTTIDAAAAKFEAKLQQLSPNADGTRVLRDAFTKDLARVNAGLAQQTMTPADAQARARQWGELAQALIPGKDPQEVVGSNGGVTFSQPARVNLEAAGDWSLTTRCEGQDVQAFVARSMLEGTGSWDQGLDTLQQVADAMPAPGQRQTLEERAAMLGDVRGAQQDYFASVDRSSAPTFKASSLGLMSNPGQSLGTSRGVTTEFISSAVDDVAAYNQAAMQFATALHQANIPAEYQPVKLGANALKDDSWSFRGGDTNPLHYFAVDVRNPTTGQAEQNVYHLDPGTGVLTQVSNLDAKGQRLQAPKSGPWTAAPRAGSSATLETQLQGLGVRFVDNAGKRSAVLDKDTYLQSQSDGSYKLWKGLDGKANAITVPEAALETLTFTGGVRAKAVPQTSDNVRGQLLDLSVEQFAAHGFQLGQAGNGLRLELNDSVAYWVDQQGRLNVQDRTGPQGVDHGNPDNPILRLSAADTARITDVHGNGWAYVLSDPSASKSAVNPHPQSGAWGQYTRGVDGTPVATMSDL